MEPFCNRFFRALGALGTLVRFGAFGTHLALFTFGASLPMYANSHATCHLVTDANTQTSLNQHIIDETLMKKIFMALPNSVLPEELHTAEQRAEYKPSGDSFWFSPYLTSGGDGAIDVNIVAYPFDDGANILLIVQYLWCLDGCFLNSDKTLNYNIPSGCITEIKRPIERYSAKDLMGNTDFGDLKPGMKDKLMRWWDETDVTSKVYYGFLKDGIRIYPSVSAYDDGEYDFDFWHPYSNASFTPVHYQWNGKRFVKVEEDEYSRIEIAYGRSNVNLRNSPYGGAVIMQANEGDVFIIQSKPTIKDEDGSTWYTICYMVDKEGIMTYMPQMAETFLHVAARFARKTPLKDRDFERMAAADLRALTYNGEWYWESDEKNADGVPFASLSLTLEYGEGSLTGSHDALWGHGSRLDIVENSIEGTQQYDDGGDFYYVTTRVTSSFCDEGKGIFVEMQLYNDNEMSWRITEKECDCFLPDNVILKRVKNND